MKMMLGDKPLGCVALALAAGLANAGELIDPPIFASGNGTKTLDLLMVAKPAAINALPGVTGWVYEICERKNSQNDSCMPGKSNLNPYGGARLQLNAGDTLKVRLVNKLPRIPESEHSAEPGEQFLAQNPTNIHTHGMLVPPNRPSSSDILPTYGDNIFVSTFNPANGVPDLTSSTHMHGDIRIGSTDYQITIPTHHPSGLFWFHPHVHGISLNQVSAGLSGIITIGKVSDYVHGLPDGTGIRHLILKDIQVNANKTLNDQEDPALCDLPSTTPGECEGSSGSKWYFTVNGQQNPTISVKSAGEIWRITNASGSVTYELQLARKDDDQASRPTKMVMQLLSIDGISVTPASGTTIGGFRHVGSGKFKPIACPGIKTNSPEAICVSQLHMMPSSRAEVWVVNRDANGKIIHDDGSEAVLQTAGYSTGPAADNWPAVDLAQVSFIGGGDTFKHPPFLTVQDGKHNSNELLYTEIAKDLASANAAVGSDPACQPLPKGWKRRIYFGYPTPDDFGLGLELIDEKGRSVPGTFQDVEEFPGTGRSICLPLGRGDTPVYERWEIVNLTAEDHNFHIHQTKFWVLTDRKAVGIGNNIPARGLLQDSVPLLAGSDGCDGTIAAWRNGSCRSSRVDVEIPFVVAGDFVYHCHILEHEDGGMMATIRVASSSNNGKAGNGHTGLDHHH